MSGGRGSLLGSVLAGRNIGGLNHGFFLLAVAPLWQQVIEGAVILMAMAVAKLGARQN